VYICSAWERLSTAKSASLLEFQINVGNGCVVTLAWRINRYYLRSKCEDSGSSSNVGIDVERREKGKLILSLY
jgi:hypothetical protein